MAMKCPECGKEKVYKDPRTGELVCKNCHTIISEDMVDMERMEKL